MSELLPNPNGVAPATSDKVVPPAPPAPPAPKAPEVTFDVNQVVEVVAVRDGVFGGHRRPVDSRFSVPFSKLGSWMKCTSPAMEKVRQERAAALKAAGK